MAHFLLVYDRSEGRLLHEERYESHVDALRARFVVEAEHGSGSGDIEVVVLGAGSREDLLRTHARYFRSLEEPCISNRLTRPSSRRASLSPL